MRKARAAYYCYSAGFRVSVHDPAEEAISKYRVVLLSHGQVFQSGNGCTIFAYRPDVLNVARVCRLPTNPSQ